MATLLILPGLDGTDVFLRPLLSALPPTIRPIVVSYTEAGTGRYEDLLKLVQQTIADVPEFYVLAFSFGGPLAIMLAAEEPGRVRGVLLAASFLRLPQPRLARLEFAAVGPVIWTVRTIRRLPIWLFKRRDDPRRVAKAEIWSRVSARALAARVRAIMRVDARALARTCTQPMLCVVFDDDRVVPRASGDEILGCAPGARLVTLPGHHFAMFADPAPLARQVIGFVHDEIEVLSG
jgi:pimeloyl-ACP methyl ester carboxylesterase